MNFNPNDFNFGIGAPSLTGNASAGYGIMAPNGASAPVASYFQSSQPGAVPGANSTGQPSIPGGLGFNFDTGRLALGGLQTLGSLWQAWEANKLAKEQFKFQKDFANTNLANSIQSYNTTLEDRGRARAFTEGQTPDQAQQYIDQNRLPDRQV